MSAGFATGVVDLQTTGRRQVANDYLRSLRTRVRASATFDQMPLSSVEAEGRPDVIAFHGAALVEEWEGAVNNPKWAPLRGVAVGSVAAVAINLAQSIPWSGVGAGLRAGPLEGTSWSHRRVTLIGLGGGGAF